MLFLDLARAVFFDVAQGQCPAQQAVPAGGLVNFAEPRSQVRASNPGGGASHASAADVALHARAMRLVREQALSYTDALQACEVVDVRFAEANSAPAVLIDKARVILRAGSTTSDDGQAIVFSRRDLEATASAYDPSKREAPLTLGKPVHDAPAYGWVRALTVTADGQLMMTVSHVQPEFAAMVNERRFATRAVVFYSPSHPNNPSPGVWYLRHIAYMGAQQSMPPVVGLKRA